MRVKVKSIMCATDFSDFSNLALNYGVAMAKEFGAKLYVCHVVDVSPTAMYGDAVADLSRQHQRLIQSATDKLELLAANYSIDCEPVVVSGHAADEICRLAKEKAVELVVCSTHGRAGLKRLILGSVAERLMRILPCPLLIIRALKHELSSDGQLSLKRILVGCDFSPDSNLAFMHGLSLAQEFQSELHLVNVIESAESQETAQGEDLSESTHDQSNYAHLNQKLKDMVSDESCNWCILKTAVLTGRSYERLVDYANKHDIDIIVLGARGRGLVAKLFVGSTTDRVIRQAPCPVLAVRPLTPEDLVDGTKGSRKRSLSHHAVKSDFFSTSRQGEIVTINFHENLLVHSVDLSARDKLLDYLEQVSNTRDIRAVAFIGSDQKTGREEYIQFYNHILNADLDRNAIHKMFNAIDQLILKIVDLDKFVIHADRGRIISLLLNISLACDYRIIADDTIYQNPSVGLGMAPKGGGAFFLLKMLGHSKALEVLLSERDLTAQDALRLGIVDGVVPSEQLEKKAIEIAKTYAQIPSQSLASIKRLLNFSRKELAEYLEFENQELLRIIGPPDLSSEFWEKLMECR